MKNWYQSSTILGVLVMFFTYLFQLTGWEISNGEITDILTALTSSIAMVVAIVGRIRATKQIK